MTLITLRKKRDYLRDGEEEKNMKKKTGWPRERRFPCEIETSLSRYHSLTLLRDAIFSMAFRSSTWYAIDKKEKRKREEKNI